MPSFGNRSRANLATCHPDLQRLFNEVIKHFDCTITCGHRTEAEQDALYAKGRTTPGPKVTRAQWPNSKHNTLPSIAVDVTPYPVDWKDIKRFYYFAGVVKGIALSLDIDIRWGGDWDSDTEVTDQKFNDLPHFELRL